MKMEQMLMTLTFQLEDDQHPTTQPTQGLGHRAEGDHAPPSEEDWLQPQQFTYHKAFIA